MSEDDPEIGSVSEEAAKLVGALSDWAKDQGSVGATSGLGASLSGLADLAREIETHVGGENCTYCPLCRLIGAVRATSPEVKAHLATATTALIQAAASAMATQVPPEPQRRSGPVEKIDLDDETPWGDED
jgi:hypothetical protein